MQTDSPSLNTTTATCCQKVMRRQITKEKNGLTKYNKFCLFNPISETPTFRAQNVSDQGHNSAPVMHQYRPFLVQHPFL